MVYGISQLLAPRGPFRIKQGTVLANTGNNGDIAKTMPWPPSDICNDLESMSIKHYMKAMEFNLGPDRQ